MSEPQCFKTRMGQKFYEANVPRLIEVLERIASALETGRGEGVNTYFDDDENVKMMRETARRIGLTQLLFDIADSPANMGCENSDRLLEALRLLGLRVKVLKTEVTS